MNRLALKLWTMLKALGIMALVSGAVASAAVGGKALSHAYDVAYNGAGSVAQPSEAPTPRAMPSVVPSVVHGSVEVRRDVALERVVRRERRVGDALETWQAARRNVRMNGQGASSFDLERVERAARGLERETQ